eukprot:360291-Chlamydomonas_euryale.AAC.1
MCTCTKAGDQEGHLATAIASPRRSSIRLTCRAAHGVASAGAARRGRRRPRRGQMCFPSPQLSATQPARDSWGSHSSCASPHPACSPTLRALGGGALVAAAHLPRLPNPEAAHGVASMAMHEVAQLAGRRWPCEERSGLREARRAWWDGVPSTLLLNWHPVSVSLLS